MVLSMPQLVDKGLALGLVLMGLIAVAVGKFVVPRWVYDAMVEERDFYRANYLDLQQSILDGRNGNPTTGKK